MTHDEIIEVILAHKASKPIQFKPKEHCCNALHEGTIDQWSDYNKPVMPRFNFNCYDWRVKPEPPTPREWWIISAAQPTAFASLEEAQHFHRTCSSSVQMVHVREVLDENP